VPVLGVESPKTQRRGRSKEPDKNRLPQKDGGLKRMVRTWRYPEIFKGFYISESIFLT